jgi:uncharacterized membrane protein
MEYLYAYLIATVILFALDFIWLGTMGNRFYRKHLGKLMADDVKLGVAGAFYLTYTVGIVVFAVVPGMRENSYLLTAGYAALFGFLAYGTYDFTNLATIRNWPAIVSIADIIWGTFVSTITAIATVFALQYFAIEF